LGHTIIGVFRHSGDADLVAAHLQTEYTLMANELDIIGQAEWDNLTPPAPTGFTPEREWVFSAITGIGLQAHMGDVDPIGKRWGDKVWEGETLVVARTNDPDIATVIARDMRSSGAERVDVVPH